MQQEIRVKRCYRSGCGTILAFQGHERRPEPGEREPWFIVDRAHFERNALRLKRPPKKTLSSRPKSFGPMVREPVRIECPSCHFINTVEPADGITHSRLVPLADG